MLGQTVHQFLNGFYNIWKLSRVYMYLYKRALFYGVMQSYVYVYH